MGGAAQARRLRPGGAGRTLPKGHPGAPKAAGPEASGPPPRSRERACPGPRGPRGRGRGSETRWRGRGAELRFPRGRLGTEPPPRNPTRLRAVGEGPPGGRPSGDSPPAMPTPARLRALVPGPWAGLRAPTSWVPGPGRGRVGGVEGLRPPPDALPGGPSGLGVRRGTDGPSRPSPASGQARRSRNLESFGTSFLTPGRFSVPALPLGMGERGREGELQRRGRPGPPPGLLPRAPLPTPPPSMGCRMRLGSAYADGAPAERAPRGGGGDQTQGGHTG